MKKKIAFVIIRYGADVNGGAELHCRMLAERLVPYYNVEVLTSTIRIFGDPGQNYPAGTEVDNGVTVRRFPAQPVDGANYGLFRNRCKRARRLRQYLHAVGLLRPISSLHPIWTFGAEQELRYFLSQEGHTPELLEHIAAHHEEYTALIFMNFYYGQAVLGSVIAPEKSILVPMAHPDKPLYYSMNAPMFTRVRHIAFNTPAEERLCRSVFGRALAPSSILGTGIEEAAPADWEQVRAKYGLPARYVLYLGRVTKPKIDRLLPNYERYLRRYGDHQATLVLTGGIDPDIRRPENPSILFTGYVSDEEKSAIVRHATVMVNPSPMESLSLLMLEAMQNRIPLLINGRSEVMKDHCKLSGAAWWYNNAGDFCRKLHRLLSDPELCRSMGENGPDYVRKNYDWEVIIPKLRALIESI